MLDRFTPIRFGNFLHRPRSEKHGSLRDRANSLGCGHGLHTIHRHARILLPVHLAEYPALLGTPAAARVAGRTRDLFTYLLERFRLGLLPPLPQARDERVIRYHRPCHIRTMDVGAPAVEFLDLLGFAVEEIDRGCCGLAGSFGYGRGESGHDLSMAIGEPLFQALREARADLCVTECSTCRMQITHGWGGAVAHPLELVWELIQSVAPGA